MPGLTAKGRLEVDETGDEEGGSAQDGGQGEDARHRHPTMRRMGKLRLNTRRHRHIDKISVDIVDDLTK